MKSAAAKITINPPTGLAKFGTNRIGETKSILRLRESQSGKSQEDAPSRDSRQVASTAAFAKSVEPYCWLFLSIVWPHRQCFSSVRTGLESLPQPCWTRALSVEAHRKTEAW